MSSTQMHLTEAQYSARFPAIRLAPAELVCGDDTPNTRGAPYFLRGRDPEIATLARGILNMPKPVRLITGPPGSGKSSLLTYMGAYAKLQGFETCFIEAYDWSSRKQLAKRILSDRATNRDESICASDAGMLDAEATSAGERSGRYQPVLSPIDAIIQRAGKAENGLLILVDEFQNLVRNDEHTRTLIASVLDFFHSSLPQGNVTDVEGRPVRAMLLAAGLWDSLQATRSFNLSQISGEDCTRLVRLSPVVAEQVIRDHLNVRPKGKQALAAATDEQVTRIAASSEGYPHHLSVAAHLAQSMAESIRLDGDENLSDDAVDQIVTWSNERKPDLYSQWVHRLGDGRQYIAMVAADLASAWPTGIPPAVMTEVLIRIRDRVRNSGGRCSIGQLEETLQRAGILEHRAAGGRFPSAIKPAGRSLDEHWTIPIPSITSYIQHNRNQFQSPSNLTVDINDLIDDEAKRLYPAPQPWEWCDRATMLSARKLPPISKSKIVAWSKKRSGMDTN